jgi:hypothetical protein
MASKDSIKPHKIQRLEVQINTDDKMMGLKLQDEFSQLCRDKLIKLLDAEFSKCSADDVVMRIDRLEVDLGQFKHYLDKDQILRELPDKLTTALNEAHRNGLVSTFKMPIKGHSEQPKSSVLADPFDSMDPDLEFIEPDEFSDDDAFIAMAQKRGQTPEQLWESMSKVQADASNESGSSNEGRSDRQGILYYLLSGQLAWWSDDFSGAEVSRLLSLFTPDDAPHLLQLMQRYPQITARVGTQASANEQAKLLDLLAQQNIGLDVLKFVNACHQALNRYRSKSSVTVQSSSGQTERDWPPLTSTSPFVQLAWLGLVDWLKYQPSAEVSFAGLLDQWRKQSEFEGWRMRILAIFEQDGQSQFDAKYTPFLHQLGQVSKTDTADTPVEMPTVEPLAQLPVLPECVDACTQQIMVDNAGLAMLVIQLPILFVYLGLVEADKFVNVIAQQKAVHLLAYLVQGEPEADDEAGAETGLSESELVLNKLLCGLHPMDLVWRDCVLDEREKTAADQLLNDVIEGFDSLKGMAIDEFREVYLRRRGMVCIRDHLWLLRIQSEGRDIFIHQHLSPCYSVCYPWMPVTMGIEWCDHDCQNHQI